MRRQSCFTKPQKPIGRLEDSGAAKLQQALPPFLCLRRGVPAKQPVETNIERIRYVAKPVQRKVDGGHGKIASGVRG